MVQVLPTRARPGARVLGMLGGHSAHYSGVGGAKPSLQPEWAPSCLPPVGREEPWAPGGSGRLRLGPPATWDTYLLSRVPQQHQLGVEVRGAQAGGGLVALGCGGSRSHNGCKSRGRGGGQGWWRRGGQQNSHSLIPGAFHHCGGSSRANLLGTSTDSQKPLKMLFGGAWVA